MAKMFAFPAALFALAAGPLPAQDAARPSSDEIVVTAQRSGIPVWRVRSGGSTLILVGTIEDVAKGTNWKPPSLAMALRGADQVMFPQGTQYGAGVFQMLSAPGKVRRMQRLPANQTLAAYLPPEQLRRLTAPRDSGYLKSGFEYRRPLFVAYDLIQAAKREPSGGFLSISRVDWKTDPEGFVRNEVNRNHLRLVPMRSERLTAALDDLAAMPPGAQLPCLSAATGFAEAGPGIFQARSQAWASRRIAQVVNSPAEKAFVTCGAIVRHEPDAESVRSAVLATLRQPLTTVAVLELSTLAASGGLLDYLESHGFEISGPRWK